jgi:hypothetical protein
VISAFVLEFSFWAMSFGSLIGELANHHQSYLRFFKNMMPKLDPRTEGNKR